jgi:formate hydrogenlyase subunit 3/multisubunit Na+/H+ antiporter MnhD subunit
MLPVPVENLPIFPGLLLLVVALPLVVACALVSEPLRHVAIRLAPWTALPAVVLAVVAPPEYAETFGWLLLGTRLALDEVGRVFLFFVALIWLIAGVFSHHTVAKGPKSARFYAFFLLTLAGNLGVAIARDLPGFLFFYSLMGLSSYGLVIHQQDERAVEAGRIYMAMLIIGEGLLYAAAVMAAAGATSWSAADITQAVASSPNRTIIGGLLLCGFGIKAGFVPLHVSLPPAYEAAPASAGAALSGAMSKAGVLGWLLFLPIGLTPMPGLGWVFMLGGIFAAYYGVIVGLMQRDPKAMLAYSSISQIGFMSLLIGVGLISAELRRPVFVACAIYALHHGLSKGALFLGVRVAEEGATKPWSRRLVLAGLILPSIALAGAPLTGGAVAKHGLSVSLPVDMLIFGTWLEMMVKFAAVGTAVLLARFVYILRERLPRQQNPDTPKRASPRRALWMPWALLIAAMLLAPWFFPWEQMAELARETLTVDSVIGEAWPLVIAAVLIALVIRLGARFPRISALRIPAGDLLVPAVFGLRTLGRVLNRVALGIAYQWTKAASLVRQQIEHLDRVTNRLESAEDVLSYWYVGATLFVVLVVVFFGVSWVF